MFSLSLTLCLCCQVQVRLLGDSTGAAGLGRAVAVSAALGAGSEPCCGFR